MQGKRNDLLYNKIINYVKKHGKIESAKLHKFLENKLGIKFVSSRSRVIAKLIKANQLERIGQPSYKSLIKIME